MLFRFLFILDILFCFILSSAFLFVYGYVFHCLTFLAITSILVLLYIHHYNL